MRVLCAMSGGVDSSVTAALLQQQGHEVVGATMKLWGGASDSGCCSLSDVEDARRVAQQLGIVHHVFNFGEEFLEHVVDPYVKAHAGGRTPNPCVECNRHIKFARFIQRAQQLGFDAVATGHHARIVRNGDKFELRRGVDERKDQSYVLHMLDQQALSVCLLPVGEMTKTRVRELAVELGLRTAKKPDSQDVCFVMATSGGRTTFLGERISLKPGRLVDAKSGASLGTIDAVEMVTVGQRKGMGGGTENRRYAVDVDTAAGVVTVGDAEDLLRNGVDITDVSFTDDPIANGAAVTLQVSAHGSPFDAIFMGDHIEFLAPQRRVAPGQSVVFYDGDKVMGGAIAQ
jgi:tRNA-uridine 2-sulfurtransferase